MTSGPPMIPPSGGTGNPPDPGLLEAIMLIGQVERRVENIHATLAALKVQFDREVPTLAYKDDLLALSTLFEARLGAFLTKSELHVFFDRIAEVRQEVGTMTTELRSASAALETRLETSWQKLSASMADRLQALERDFAETKRGVEEAGRSNAALRERLQSIAEQQISVAASIRSETERLSTKVQEIANLQATAVGDLRVETQKVRTEVGEQVRELGLDTQKVRTEMADLRAEVKHSVNRAVLLAVASTIPIATLIATFATFVIKALQLGSGTP